MPKYTSRPVTVEAQQYVASDGADVAGNVDELDSFVGEAQLQHQVPWNPAAGQSCLLVLNEGREPQLASGGDYLIKTEQGVIVAPKDLFEADYVIPADQGAVEVPVTITPAAPAPTA